MESETRFLTEYLAVKPMILALTLLGLKARGFLRHFDLNIPPNRGFLGAILLP